MIDPIKQPWILTGYELFAGEGPNALKVEVISRLVHKSKSSFYHHFADLEVFTELLLAYHLDRIKLIVEREKMCRTLIPELMNLMLEVKQDLFFQRQLRIYRNVPKFKACLEKANRISDDAILGIWADALGLSDKSHLAGIVLALATENFYLQLTEETFTKDWFVNYIQELRFMINEIKRNDHR